MIQGNLSARGWTRTAAASSVKARNDAGNTTAGAPVTLRVTDNDDVSSGATSQTIEAPANTANGNSRSMKA